MRKTLTILFFGIILILLGGYFILPSEVKSLSNTDIKEPQLKFKIERTAIESQIKELYQFKKVEVSYSIEGKLNEENKNYNFENLVVVYIDQKENLEELEINKIGEKISDIISENIINLENYKKIKIVFKEDENDKFNDSKSFIFPLTTK